ncbi:membrane or secreted protein [Pedobacter sp. L105]|uniref:membrane or secreted protein n=1 Tax=Pedobacter sp. L105 TaxID=1641871 RepID=UPI00131D067B|nr:membrane or secreted protein [Pedobacter sp. L105]
MKKSLFLTVYVLFLGMILPFTLKAQSEGDLTVDTKGILRWKKTGTEASFFGVNYTVPFAYGYRSHKALGVNPELAIDNDVYHMARLGINAFRVHVWDTEISDVEGNLINNEHLRLFDYLLSKLEERGIHILITPIAFWGNGYPEKDEKTGSFSNVYGKEQSVVNEKAIQAQERYLQQLFSHVNPYTKKTYGIDPFVVAAELNNEPKHSGPKSLATAYINRLAVALRSTGWTKPVFYNISESPRYADAVAAAKVDGFSFQWYPIGLVAGHEQKGNFLPNVDRYVIPFDTIPAFLNKPRIIYEFDAADVLQSFLYPAMARSFRTAGFQWATQFAYDPMATAYANTEYQTHYLNLAYTPSKAISLLIAGEVFRTTPLFKSFGSYPADTLFSDFRLSYKENLSEMNGKKTFYYSNTTPTRPANLKTLEHIAGVGSSVMVKYKGTGAYFLDKLADGNWRLEVMPDVQRISDPFATASPDKEVNKIRWAANPISIILPDLNAAFYILGLNKGNTFQAKASKNSFLVTPGTYLLSDKQLNEKELPLRSTGKIGLREFVAPMPVVIKNPTIQKPDPDGFFFSGPGLPIVLFDAAKPPRNINFYLEEWSKNSYAFTTADQDKNAALNIKHLASPVKRNGGLEIYIGEILRHAGDLTAYHYLVFTASVNHGLNVHLSLISGSAVSYSDIAKLDQQTKDIKIPLSAFKPSQLLLLPRPYPGFQPLYFKSDNSQPFQLQNIEKFQFSYEVKENTEEAITIKNIRLEK